MAETTGGAGSGHPEDAAAEAAEPSLVAKLRTALETSPDKKEAVKARRRFVGILTGGFLLTNFLMFLRFFFPRTIFEPRTVFRIGAPTDFGIGRRHEIPKDATHLGRADNGPDVRHLRPPARTWAVRRTGNRASRSSSVPATEAATTRRESTTKARRRVRWTGRPSALTRKGRSWSTPPRSSKRRRVKRPSSTIPARF